MKSADEKYPFIPAAMLPAWLVTDGEWIVRNSNSFASQMLTVLCAEAPGSLASGRITFGEVYPKGDAVSAWACFLELDKKQAQLALDATRVMAEHVTILKRYSGESLNLDLQSLIVELRRVEGTPGVYPYVFDRVDDEEYLRMGIRVSPPEGLKLRAAVTLADPENSDPGSTSLPMSYIDFVIGYQVKLCPAPHNPACVTCVHFLGSQPAIHDATDRRRLVQLEKELEEIRTTSNLAHALRTPLSNAVAAARRISKPGARADEARRLSGPLLAQIDEADALVRLLLFVNTNDTLPVSAHLAHDAAEPTWPTITSSMVTHQIADALMSIFHMRTDRPRDRRTVLALLAAHGLPIREEQEGEDVARAFQRLAEQISGGGTASFVLAATVQSLRLSAFEVAQLARTVALNLILTELIINAVKHCDSSNPRILFNATFTEDAIQWTVENTIPPAKAVETLPKEQVKLPDTKREALGNYLNSKATKILGWRLERLEAQPGSICHRLVIPLEGTVASWS